MKRFCFLRCNCFQRIMNFWVDFLVISTLLKCHVFIETLNLSFYRFKIFLQSDHCFANFYTCWHFFELGTLVIFLDGFGWTKGQESSHIFLLLLLFVSLLNNSSIDSVYWNKKDLLVNAWNSAQINLTMTITQESNFGIR